MLQLAFLAKHTNTPPSKRLRLNDEVIALDFDLACSYVLLEWEQEQRKRELTTSINAIYKAVYMATGTAFNGGDLPELFEDDDEEDY